MSWRCLIQLVLRIAPIHIKNKLHSLDTNKLHVTPRSKPKCIFDNLYILRNFINGIMAKYQLLQPSSTSLKIYSKVHTWECTSCNKCLKIKTRASPRVNQISVLDILSFLGTWFYKINYLFRSLLPDSAFIYSQLNYSSLNISPAACPGHCWAAKHPPRNVVVAGRPVLHLRMWLRPSPNPVLPNPQAAEPPQDRKPMQTSTKLVFLSQNIFAYTKLQTEYSDFVIDWSQFQPKTEYILLFHWPYLNWAHDKSS